MANASRSAIWEGLKAHLENITDIPFVGITSIRWGTTIGAVEVGQVKGSVSFAFTGEPEGFDEWQQDTLITLAVQMESVDPDRDYPNMMDYQDVLSLTMQRVSERGLPSDIGEFRDYNVAGSLTGLEPFGGIQHAEQGVSVRAIEGADKGLATIALRMQFLASIPTGRVSGL